MYLKRLLTASTMLMLLALGCSDNGDETPSGPQDSGPVISIGDVSIIEGQPANFTVSINKVGTQTIDFSFTTNAGTAVSADFTSASGTGTIGVGEMSTNVSINTTDDGDIEGDETFSLILSKASVLFNGKDSVGVATIRDNDAAPVIQVNDLTVAEGASANFVFRLSKVQSSAVDIWFHTEDITAKAGEDYIGQPSDMETIAIGLDSVIQSVSTINDTLVESDETFRIVIDSATVAIIDSVGICTITSDDVVQTAFFGTDIVPIMNGAGCTAQGTCHGSSGNLGGLFLPNLAYSTVRNASGNHGAIVVPGDASASSLYFKTTPPPQPFGAQMPLGGPFLSTAQQNKIRDWINEGALDN